MKRFLVALSVALTTSLALGTLAAEAGSRSSKYKNSGLSQHPKSKHYRKGPQVRGFAKRRGGYSYSYSDTVNTYGDSRTNYGSADTFRDQFLDRQTKSGPFDHEFFFDSGVAPRGGNSPYLN